MRKVILPTNFQQKVNTYLSNTAEAQAQLLSYNEKISLSRAREHVDKEYKKKIRLIEDKAAGHRYIRVV